MKISLFEKINNNFFLTNILLDKRKILKYKKYFKKFFIEEDKFKLIKTHKNDVILVFFPKRNFFRKFSITERGFRKIVAEKKGLTWYYKKKEKKNNILNFCDKKNFKALDLKNIHGIKCKSWKPLQQNYNYIIRAYKHYLRIFKKKKMTNIHGDLTLDNFIFSKKDVSIIDWEFFKAKNKFWGYDLAYLFLSSITLPYIANKKCSKLDLNKFLKLWKLLDNLKVNKKIINNPFKYFENMIENDNTLSSSKKLSKKKFFPFITPLDFKKKIIQAIAKIK